GLRVTDNPHHRTVVNRFARRGVREPAHRTGHRLAGRRPRARHWRARETRSARYFLFLRWIRVFFSSLRCFFFAIRLRRFLMTEPIRPPSLRHNGRRARHRSPAAGRLGTRPKLEVSANANRSRSPPAYPLPRDGGTAMPGATPRYP